MQNTPSKENSSHQIGIVIPKNIGIGVLIAFLAQFGVGVWNISKHDARIERSIEQVEKVTQDINKIRSDIYTRSEADMQFESLRREMEIITSSNERQDDEIRELRRGAK